MENWIPVALRAGWHPSHRKIATREELLELPLDTVVKDVDSPEVWVRNDEGGVWWESAQTGDAWDVDDLPLPLIVLHEPGRMIMSNRDRDLLAAMLKAEFNRQSDSQSSPSFWKSLAQELLDTGVYVSPQIITTVQEADALPDRTIICMRYGTAAQKDDDHWGIPNEVGWFASDALDLPAIVMPQIKAGS